MSKAAATEYANVTITTKANVYFDGKVVSHTIKLASGEKKTLGLIYPGSFHFKTDAAERMDIVAGVCRVRIEGSSDFETIGAGSGFDVPAHSAFDIEVWNGITEYVCSFE